MGSGLDLQYRLLDLSAWYIIYNIVVDGLTEYTSAIATLTIRRYVLGLYPICIDISSPV